MSSNFVCFSRSITEVVECRFCPFLSKSEYQMQAHILGMHLQFKAEPDGEIKLGLKQEDNNGQQHEAGIFNGLMPPQDNQAPEDNRSRSSSESGAESTNVATPAVEDSKKTSSPETWCRVCSKSFASRDTFNAHFRTKHPDEPRERLRRGRKSLGPAVPCAECGQEFANAVSLKRHSETQHAAGNGGERPRPFPCEQCGKRFYAKHNMVSHVKTVHGKEKKK